MERVAGRYLSTLWVVRMTNYLVILENRADLSADLQSFIIQANNLKEAHEQVQEHGVPDHIDHYIQSVNSIWLHHDIRKNRVH